MSAINPLSPGISPQQAQWLVELMQAQSQSDAAAMLSGDASGDAASAQTDSFASLLSSALGVMSGADGLSGNTTVLDGVLRNLVSDGWGSISPNLINSSMFGNAGSATGNAIASVAVQLAGDLRGANNQYYDPQVTPAAAQAAFDTPGWGNGNVQCVAFVDGVFRQAGIALPATPNGADFWRAYQGLAGWQEVANGQGLPQPGDILAFSGGAQGYGHVAVVTSVTPPTNGQPGHVTFAQANSPTSQASLTIALDGTVQAWPGYQVQGYIRYAG